MSEIRYCKLTDTEVIISPERLHRPLQFNASCMEDLVENCPFEAGSETHTPGEIFSICDKEGNWLTRVVPNLYNALDIHTEKSSTREGFFTKQNGFGAHEVIIETPHHDRRVDAYTLKMWDAYIKTIIHRINDLSGDIRLEYIQVFKNHGLKAGASLVHPHSQIIATGFIPRKMRSLMLRNLDYYKVHRRSLMIDIVSEELREGKRIIFENETFVAFAPYASRHAFEIAIAPKKVINAITHLNVHQQSDLAHMVQNVYKSLYKILGEFDYNMIMHNLPPRRMESDEALFAHSEKSFTFYIEILPRLYGLAGYELATGLRINPVTPELAAEKLKEVL